MLAVTVTTIEREVGAFDGVIRITIPTRDGIITVLPGHVPLMTALGMGEIEIQTDKEVVDLFVDGGVVQVDNDHVEVLANMAERAEEIDAAKVEEAKRRAEKLLQERPIDEDLAAIGASLQREMVRLNISQKHRGHMPHNFPE